MAEHGAFGAKRFYLVEQGCYSPRDKSVGFRSWEAFATLSEARKCARKLGLARITECKLVSMFGCVVDEHRDEFVPDAQNTAALTPAQAGSRGNRPMTDLDKVSVLNAEPGSSAAPSVARFTPWQAWQERAPRGPWYVDMGERGELCVGHLPSGEPDAIGAHLIAAAPSLYEALAEMCRQFTYGNPDQRDAIRRARDALDKAVPPTGPVNDGTTSNTDSSP